MADMVAVDFNPRENNVLQNINKCHRHDRYRSRGFQSTEIRAY